ncbi:18472_t:CDS:10 [Entrophospora sp. SA101]|nr:18472_t:CDS:10 [Entrophospora sp. SA101]
MSNLKILVVIDYAMKIRVNSSKNNSFGLIWARRQSNQSHQTPTPATVQVPLSIKRPKRPKKSSSESLDPKTKKILKGLSLVGAGTGIFFIAYSGRPFETDRENQYKDLGSFTAWYKRVEARNRDLFHFFTEPPSDKLLPDKDVTNSPPLTLVINLDQTLIYSSWDREHGWRTAKRPGLDFFLFVISNLYEVVFFTSQPSHDVSKLNRDISKVIIMDSNPDSYSLQPENAITVPPWKGDPNDTFLIDIIPFLECLANIASYLGGSHMQESMVPPYEQKFHERQSLNKHLHEQFKSLKEQAPEAQKRWKQDLENYEKQFNESMKEQKMTIWQLATKGPPQISIPPPEISQDLQQAQHS